MRNYLLLVLLWCCGVSGCGGGSVSGGSVASGSPSVSLSTNTLTFGDEVLGTTSQPLTVTLTNSGTATLAITSIVASANFAEDNNCGSAIAPAASCIVNVTLSPSLSGSLSGTVSFTDNAGGSPQIVSLSGTGTVGTTTDTLTGYCWGLVSPGAPNQCRFGQDLAQCPAGQLAVAPTTVVGCLPPANMLVDISIPCQFSTSGGQSGSGSCVAQVSSSGGSCSVRGQECGAAQLSPCCPGLLCVPASTRAFCEPAGGENARRAPSQWEHRIADRLR